MSIKHLQKQLREALGFKPRGVIGAFEEAADREGFTVEVSEKVHWDSTGAAPGPLDGNAAATGAPYSQDFRILSYRNEVLTEARHLVLKGPSTMTLTLSTGTADDGSGFADGTNEVRFYTDATGVAGFDIDSTVAVTLAELKLYVVGEKGPTDLALHNGTLRVTMT